MRLTIFWRVIFAQISLITLIGVASVYALAQLNWLTSLSTDILTTDSAAIEEEKRLLQIFLAQIRNAEKYLLLQDKVFYNHVTQGSHDFDSIAEKVASLVTSAPERELLEEIRDLQFRYAEGLATAFSRTSPWKKDKTAISDEIIEGINQMIDHREDAAARKTMAARDQAARAAQMMGWLTIGGISLAILLANFSARSVSRPLKNLAQELRWVGRGAFGRSLDIRAPKEVSELAQAFNWMAERLAELDAMKADFVAHVSHELRTPITAIQEGTALLLEEIPGPLSASQREIVEVVQNHSQRLFHSLSSVLDLSKMEAGMMEYEWMPSDLLALIERSIENVRLIAQKKEIQVEMSCAAALPLLLVDERRIQQVLDNLLSNAMKFTPAGGTITISTSLMENGEGPGQWVEVRVADTGVGIPEGEERRIFERFYQSRHRHREHWRGTGLGLAIARYIVEAHGGQIWVESRAGEGSTFAFTLPLHKNISDGGRAQTTELMLPSGVGHAA